MEILIHNPSKLKITLSSKAAYCLFVHTCISFVGEEPFHQIVHVKIVAFERIVCAHLSQTICLKFKQAIYRFWGQNCIFNQIKKNDTCQDPH